MDNPLTLGRAVRAAMAELLTPDALVDRGYPERVEPSTGRKGMLSDLDWIESVGLGAHSDALRQMLAQPSELLDAFFGAMGQAMSHAARLMADPMTPGLAPLIVQHGRSGTRLGFLTLATDRDAFIEELLGRPVPRSPRYAAAPPEMPARLSGDIADVQASLGFSPREGSTLYDQSRDEALRHLKELNPLIDRRAGDDFVRALLKLLATRNPPAFADSPVGRVLLPVARAAPRWRTPNIRAELATTFDLGAMTRLVTIVVWPRAAELRRDRRTMAAYLRRVFDHRVAPWARRRDARTRRELILLHFRRGWPAMEIPGRTVKETAAALRHHHPAAYAEETLGQALKRLYYFSAEMR